MRFILLLSDNKLSFRDQVFLLFRQAEDKQKWCLYVTERREDLNAGNKFIDLQHKGLYKAEYSQ